MKLIQQKPMGDGAFCAIYEYTDFQGNPLYSVYETPQYGGDKQLVRKSIMSLEEAIKYADSLK